MTVTVRAESPGDAEAVRIINERAFGRPDEAALVDTLRGVAGAISLVATIDDSVHPERRRGVHPERRRGVHPERSRGVGHILFTRVALDGHDGRAIGLAPMAVLPEHQRQGIGSRLVRAGLDACRAKGHDLVVVLGPPAFYSRFGFVPAHTRGLTCEFPVPPEAFMALDLAPEPRQFAALVRYRPEFTHT